MVPPALTEVRQDVLPRELKEFIEDAPKVANNGVSKHEGGKKPVNPVNEIVVVQIAPEILQGQVAVVIIGMEVLSHRLVKLGVQEPEQSATSLRSLLNFSESLCYYLVKKEDDEASVYLSQTHNDPLIPLIRSKDLIQEGVQVAEGTHK